MNTTDSTGFSSLFTAINRISSQTIDPGSIRERRLSARSQNLSQENSRLESQNNQLESRNNQLKSENRSLQQDVNELEVQVSRLGQELSRAERSGATESGQEIRAAEPASPASAPGESRRAVDSASTPVAAATAPARQDPEPGKVINTFA